MNPTVPMEWHRLFNGAFNDTLTPEEKEQLAALLASTPEARQLWYLYGDNECSLAELKRPAPALREITHAPSNTPSSWFRSRTLHAAAAGLVVGLLCASVGWAVAVPGILGIKSRPLPLADPGFETGPAPEMVGVPRKFGIWSGDFSAVSTGERDVSPSEGKRMLRLLRADNQNTPPGSEPGVAEVWQAIDITPFRKAKDNTPIAVELIAQFNAADTSRDERTVFGVSLEAFSGEARQLPQLWHNRRDTALVRSGHEQPAGHKPGTWQTVSSQLSLPQDANILLVHLYAVRKGKGPIPPEFSGHFVDGVSLRLLEADPQPILSKR